MSVSKMQREATVVEGCQGAAVKWLSLLPREGRSIVARRLQDQLFKILIMPQKRYDMLARDQISHQSTYHGYESKL